MKMPLGHLADGKMSECEVADSLFAPCVRRDMIERVVRWQLAKRQSGTHSTLHMGEVRGSTAKPFKQKKTGRARQGSRHGPHFRGGGIVFGPVVRSHAHDMPRQIRRLALKSALRAKRDEKNFIVIDDMSLSSSKTKELVANLKKMGVTSAFMVAGEALNDKLRLASRNIPHVSLVKCGGINVYDIMRHAHLLIAKESLPYLEARLS